MTRSYGQYCPISKASELLGDRWTLLIVRELLFGPLRFTDMEEGLPGISRSVLSDRLKNLQRAGICEKTSDGAYRFTDAGEAMRPVLQSMGDWVARWIMNDPTPAESDPRLLILFISRHVNREALPEERVVAEFRLSDPDDVIWLLLECDDVSVCPEDPGLPIDLVVEARTPDLYRVYIGRTTLDTERAEGRIEIRGRPSMVNAFPGWMKWSSFTEASRQAVSAAGQ
ncbi:MAG: winged helix-turn-helix transcriptional regulator [Actinomycetota bacterium]